MKSMRYHCTFIGIAKYKNLTIPITGKGEEQQISFIEEYKMIQSLWKRLAVSCKVKCPPTKKTSSLSPRFLQTCKHISDINLPGYCNKYHRLSGLNIYFLTALKAESPRLRCHQDWYLVIALSLACRWLLSHCVLTCPLFCVCLSS